MKRLYNLLGIATSVIVLSAVMLVVSVAAQPAQAEQQPDTLLRETIEYQLPQSIAIAPIRTPNRLQIGGRD